jgi:hypothetical protein
MMVHACSSSVSGAETGELLEPSSRPTRVTQLDTVSKKKKKTLTLF